MRPTKIPGATRNLSKPVDWDESKSGECGDLLVRDDIWSDGMPTMISHWKPTQAELEILNAGGVVELMVCGRMHPPVSIIAAESE